MTEPEPAGPVRGRRALLMHVLWRSLRSHPRDTGWLAAWSLVQALPSFAAGWAVAEATADFLAGPPAVISGLAWLGALGLATLVGALASRRTYLRVATLVEPLRDDLVRIIVHGALRRATRGAGHQDNGAVARITHQAEIVRDSFGGLLAVSLTFVVTVASAVAGLAELVPQVLPLAVGPMTVSLILFCCLLPPMASRQRRAVVGEEAVADSVASALAGLRDVLACGTEDQVGEGIDEQVTAQVAALRAVARMNLLRTLCLAVGGWLPLALVLADTPSLVRHGISPGAIIGAVTYLGGVLPGALYGLTRGLGGSGIRLAITLQRIVEASQWPGTAPGADGWPPDGRLPAGPAARPSAAAAARCDVSLRRVSFGYGPQAEPVLHALDLEIPDGEHVAIVGPSGIGKSTLASLIAGLLPPTAGQVRLGGRALTGIAPADRPRYRVLIPQEAYVFAGTLAENLSYLAPGAPAAQLDAAASAVGLTPLVERLGGYHAALRPARLSGGERQLIALGRAYLSPARLAILDEATSNLDPDAAARAESAFAARPGTLIVIAHRMSSALRADRVLVLDGAQPKIGEHAALLACSPMYRDLVGHWQPDAAPAGPVPAGPVCDGPRSAGPVPAKFHRAAGAR
jgi:ATP-binding cassette subfamily C protein